MMLYTIKDFLKYATPCYWCGEKCNVELINYGKNQYNFKLGEFNFPNLIFASPKLTIKFNSYNNKFKTNNKLLIDKNDFKFIIKCECGLTHCSKIIRPNISTNYIEPFEITASYKFDDDLGTCAFEDNDSVGVGVIRPIYKVCKIPGKSLRDFKNKEALLERIKIYLLFS